MVKGVCLVYAKPHAQFLSLKERQKSVITDGWNLTGFGITWVGGIGFDEIRCLLSKSVREFSERIY